MLDIAYFSKFFAVEGRLGFGVQDDTVGAANGEIDYLVGAYVRGGFPLGIFEPYVIAGATMIDTSWGFVDGDDVGLSYGVGADFKFNEKFGINLEYMYLMDFDGMTAQPAGIDVDSLSVGCKFYF